MITVSLSSVKQLCKDNGCWLICDYPNFFLQDMVTKAIKCQGRRKSNEMFQIPVYVFSRVFPRASAFWGQAVKSKISSMLKKSDVSFSLDSTHAMCSD